VAYDDGGCAYSRETGQSEYLALPFCYATDLRRAAVRREKYDSFLDLDIRGTAYSLRFSQFEEDAIRPMIERWTAVRAAAPAQSTAAPVPSEERAAADAGTPALPEGLSPAAVFAAALMFVASVDAEIDAEEKAYIERFWPATGPVYEAAVVFHNAHSAEELFPALAALSHQQKLCVLANAIEIAMSDGALRRAEQHMIRDLAAAAGLDEKDSRAAYDVLLIKNQISVFT
jgi:tellurite resistance protein